MPPLIPRPRKSPERKASQPALFRISPSAFRATPTRAIRRGRVAEIKKESRFWSAVFGSTQSPSSAARYSADTRTFLRDQRRSWRARDYERGLSLLQLLGLKK